LVLATFFATACLGQVPIPKFKYTLHAQKEPGRGPDFVFALAPDNALLVLIPQSSRKWVLKRLTGWDTQAPHEETLEIGLGSDQNKVARVEADLTMNPSASYLIVRLIGRHGAVDANGINSDTIVTLVDLRAFGIVWQHITTDPLIADSQWHFREGGLLIAKGLAKRIEAKPRNLDTITDTYVAAALALPDLKPTNACQYDEVLEPGSGGTGRKTQASGSASIDCAAVLEAAGVSALNELPGGRSQTSDSVAKLAGPTCQIEGASPEKKFALIECRTEHSLTDGFYSWITSRVYEVVSIPDGKTILSVPLPHNWHPIFGSVATANGHDYLILIREGIQFEAYALN
jgi:hypothetical protein